MSQEYIIGDVRDELQNISDAALIHLDDAWARPARNDYGETPIGVKYPTHDFEITQEVLDLCYESLEDGGWLIMDVDDWLLPRAINYIRETWGDVNDPPAYQGGGYRKTGRVVYITADGSPNRSGTSKYLRQSGYPVVFAHKGETDRYGYESVIQQCRKRREKYGWGTVKPLEPYEAWLDELAEQGDLVVEPCAGTAPACVAAEKLYGDNIDFVAIDIMEEAKITYQNRREAVLG